MIAQAEPMVDWQRVDTVWLDLDGTILDLCFDTHFWHEHLPQQYARAQGIGRAHAEQRLAPLFTATAGRLPFYDIDFWQHETGLDMLAIKRELAHLVRPLDGVLPALERMADAGLQLALATNAHPAVVTFKFECVDLDGWFAPLVSSHEVGHAKEAAGFWQSLVDDYGLVPERALFVDDNQAVADAARKYGIGQVVGLTRPDSWGAERVHTSGMSMPDLASLVATLPENI